MLETKLGSSARAASTFNHGTIALAPENRNVNVYHNFATEQGNSNVVTEPARVIPIKINMLSVFLHFQGKH